MANKTIPSPYPQFDNHGKQGFDAAANKAAQHKPKQTATMPAPDAADRGQGGGLTNT